MRIYAYLIGHLILYLIKKGWVDPKDLELIETKDAG